MADKRSKNLNKMDVIYERPQEASFLRILQGCTIYQLIGTIQFFFLEVVWYESRFVINYTRDEVEVAIFIVSYLLKWNIPKSSSVWFVYRVIASFHSNIKCHSIYK